MSDFSHLSDQEIINRVRFLSDKLDNELAPAVEQAYKEYSEALEELKLLEEEIDRKIKELGNEDET